MKGFTLIELLVVVVILSVLAAIGVPMYSGYLDAADVSVVHNNLRSIYLQEQEYFINNNGFYNTGATCVDSTAAINTTLFAGTQVLETEQGFYYCITQASAAEFLAEAREITGTRIFTINHLNVTNF